MNREHRKLLLDGRLLLISPYDPSAGFNVGNAMQRNKVKKAVEAVRPLAEARRQRLSVDLAPDVVLSADPTRLAQVLGNLLNNAVKYTPDGGQVELSLERADDEAVFTVRDTGAGIAAAKLASVERLVRSV